MTEVDLIADELQHGYDGDPWHGDALLAILRDVAVRALDAAKLHTPVNDTRERALGTGKSHAATLHGIAQHDAYHAGQISLLKKA